MADQRFWSTAVAIGAGSAIAWLLYRQTSRCAPALQPAMQPSSPGASAAVAAPSERPRDAATSLQTMSFAERMASASQAKRASRRVSVCSPLEQVDEDHVGEAGFSDAESDGGDGEVWTPPAARTDSAAPVTALSTCVPVSVPVSRRPPTAEWTDYDDAQGRCCKVALRL